MFGFCEVSPKGNDGHVGLAVKLFVINFYHHIFSFFSAV